MSSSSFALSLAVAYFSTSTNLHEQDRQVRAISMITILAIDVICGQLTAQSKCSGSRKHLLWAFFFETLHHERCMYDCIQVFKRKLGDSCAGSL